MKLPEIKYTMGVQPLGKHPIGLALSVANAKAAAARQEGRALIAEGAAKASMGELVATGIYGAAQIGHAYVQWENQKAMNDADLKVATDMSQWKKQWEGQPFVSGSQVPADIQVERTEIINDPQIGEVEQERQVPSYEVLPQMKKQYREKLIQEQSKNISLPGQKKAWINRQSLATEEIYGRDVVRAAQAYAASMKADYEMQFNMALRDNNWGLAAEVVKRFPGTNTKKKAMFTVLNKTRTMHGLDDVLTQRELPVMQNALEQVKNGITSLTDAEEKSYASQLRTAIAQETAASANVAKFRMNATIKDAKDLISAVESGMFVDPKILSESMESLKAIEGLDDRVPMTQRAMAVAMSLSPQLLTFSLQPIHAQDAIIDAAKAGSTNAQDINRIRILESLRDRNASALDKDPLRYAENAKLINIQQVDWTKMYKEKSFGEMASVMKNRIQAAQVTNDQLDAFGGFLTKPESLEWVNMIDKMSYDEKVEIMGVVESGFGSLAPYFYEQLAGAGLKGSFVIAGQLSAEGMEEHAESVLRGDAVRKTNPEVISKIKDELVRTLPEYIGNVYQRNPERRNRVREAILSVYAAQAEGEKSHESFNEDYFERAIESVTGGVIEYNGSYIEAPVWGLSESSFKRWLGNLTPEYVTELGTPANFTPNQILKFIKNGKLKLKSASKRQYYLYDDNFDAVVMDEETGMPYMFKYDANLTEDYRKDIDAAKKRAAAHAADMKAGRQRMPVFLGQDGVEDFDPMQQFMGN